MGIITIGFLLFGLLILIVILAGVVRIQNNSAKKEARKILAEGNISNPKKLKWAMGVLNKMSKDMEAADLWKRLQELKEKS